LPDESQYSDHHYTFELMKEQRHALEQLQADFRWGPYGIRVIRFHHTTFPPGKIDLFHIHAEEYEFHFIPRGHGKVILEENSFQLHEGMMYLTAPSVAHYQEADPYEAMDELCLRIKIIKLEDRAPAPGWGEDHEWNEAVACIKQLNAIPKRPTIDRFRAMEPFLTAYRAWYEGQSGLMTTIKQAIIQILLRTARGYFPEPQKAMPSRDMNWFRCRLAQQFIKDNYADQLSLEDVADRIHISPRQLQRILKAYTGSTFSSYVEKMRLTNICTELERTSETIEALAIKHGFPNTNYLHRVFKKRYDMTPKQYRKLKQEELKLEESAQ